MYRYAAFLIYGVLGSCLAQLPAEPPLVLPIEELPLPAAVASSTEPDPMVVLLGQAYSRAIHEAHLAPLQAIGSSAEIKTAADLVGYQKGANEATRRMAWLPVSAELTRRSKAGANIDEIKKFYRDLAIGFKGAE